MGGRLPRRPPGEEARVVLDPLAVPDLLQHLEIEAGTLLQPLGLQQLVLGAQFVQPAGQLRADLVDRVHHRVARRDVVVLRIDGVARDAARHLPGQGIEARQGFDLVVEELDPHRLAFGLRRVDVDHVPAHPVGPPAKLQGSTGVLKLREAAQQLALVDPPTAHEVQHHGVKRFRVAEAVDRGHGGDDDRVGPFEQCLGGREPHLLHVLVDGGVLLDVGVGRGDVRLGLVVVVVGDEVLDGVARKELAHLPVELGGEGLVGGEHQGRALHGLDDVGDGEGLAGPGDPEQGLVRKAAREAIHEGGGGRSLVPGRPEVGFEREAAGAAPLPRAGFAHRIRRAVPAAAAAPATAVRTVQDFAPLGSRHSLCGRRSYSPRRPAAARVRLQ